nr:hypothetical protein StreXyl84_00200 [Streptomyces sp. Xyl84]
MDTHYDHSHAHSDAHGDHPHGGRTNPGDHDHGHRHGSGWWARARHEVAHLVRPHSHEAMDKVDSVMETSREGMRTLWLSLGILGATAVVQGGDRGPVRIGGAAGRHHP